MYDTILEFITNADSLYRLWMVAELQHPTPPETQAHNRVNNLPIPKVRSQWFPDLVNQFPDESVIPDVIRVSKHDHALDSDMRFHTGNKKPSIDINRMVLWWGGYEDLPIHKDGPAIVNLSGLKMWHHQDDLHRRRGDAIICSQAEFQWNTKENMGGAFRERGPYRIVIKDFRAEYHMGVATDASFQHMSVSWGNESGIRLGEGRVQKVIDNNGIKTNFLKVETAFEDDGEEFIFWDEVSREQN